MRPSSSTRLAITQSPSTGTRASATRCRAASSEKPSEDPSADRSVMTADTSAISASRRVARRANSSATRRSVMSRKDTDSPSGVGQARTSNHASSGSG